MGKSIYQGIKNHCIWCGKYFTPAELRAPLSSSSAIVTMSYKKGSVPFHKACFNKAVK